MGYVESFGRRLVVGNRGRGPELDVPLLKALIPVSIVGDATPVPSLHISIKILSTCALYQQVDSNLSIGQTFIPFLMVDILQTWIMS
jgi:hypothetical protein